MTLIRYALCALALGCLPPAWASTGRFPKLSSL